MDNSDFKHGVIIASVVVLGAAAMLWVMYRFVVPDNVPLSDSNLTIVLSFIGVLATFIVVGNYAQVNEIRRNMERDLERGASEIDAMRGKVNDLRRDVDNHTQDISDLDDTDSLLAEDLALVKTLHNDIDKLQKQLVDYKKLLLQSLSSSYGEYYKVLHLLEGLTYGATEKTYSIRVTIGKSIKTKTVRAEIAENEIRFYDNNTFYESSDIKAIDGVKIRIPELISLLKLYLDLYSVKSEKMYTDDTKQIKEEDIEDGDEDVYVEE